MACAQWPTIGLLLLPTLLGCPAEDSSSAGGGAGGTGGEAGAPTGGMGGSAGAEGGGGAAGGSGGSGGAPEPTPDPELCAKLEVVPTPTVGASTEAEAAANVLSPGVVYEISVPSAGPVYVAFPTVSEHTTFGAYVDAKGARVLRAGVEIAATNELIGCEGSVFAKVTHHAHMPSVFVLEIDADGAPQVIGMFEVLSIGL